MSIISAKTDKPKDTKGTFLRICQYIGFYKWLIVLAIILAMCSNLLALIGPKLSGAAIDVIAVGRGQVDFSKIYDYATWMIICYIISAILSWLLSVLMMYVGRQVAKKMRTTVFDKLLRLQVGFYDEHQAGDIISRISYDIDVINGSLSTDLVQIVASIITVIGAFVMMVSVCPPLVTVVLLSIPLSILYTKYMAKKTRPLFLKRSARYGVMNGFTEEMFSGQKTIRAYAHEQKMIERFDTINQEAGDAFFQADYYGTMTGPTVNFINNLSLSFIAIIGSILYLKERITIGQISSFVLYSRKFSAPINEAANIMNEIMSALAAAERVFRLLDEQEEVADIYNANMLTNVEGNVTCEDISFGYVKGNPIMKHFHLQAEQGKMIAIVGPTGAGKTTLINLLMRFYDVDAGNIYVDGQEIRTLTRDSLRKAYAMVLQDTWVFKGTIFENIAYGKENATLEEVMNAAKAAHIHSYIMRLPQGYQTIVEEDGNNISKGQKQLLTIARAMLYDSKMLILDEATSNVDTTTEKDIQKAMRHLMNHKTCFVIAHRLSTIQNADWILVINHGNVIEQGTHRGLMEQKGFYYDLYEAQFL